MTQPSAVAILAVYGNIIVRPLRMTRPPLYIESAQTSAKMGWGEGFSLPLAGLSGLDRSFLWIFHCRRCIKLLLSLDVKGPKYF
jgi:hypothetical protein